EGANQFAKTDHLEILVDQHKVKREQHSDAVNCVSRDNPHAAVRPKRSLAQQADQPAQNGVGDCDPKGEKSFLRLVIDKHLAVFSKHLASSCAPLGSLIAGPFFSSCRSELPEPPLQESLKLPGSK